MKMTKKRERYLRKNIEDIMEELMDNFIVPVPDLKQEKSIQNEDKQIILNTIKHFGLNVDWIPEVPERLWSDERKEYFHSRGVKGTSHPQGFIQWKGAIDNMEE